MKHLRLVIDRIHVVIDKGNIYANENDYRKAINTHNARVDFLESFLDTLEQEYMDLAREHGEI